MFEKITKKVGNKISNAVSETTQNSIVEKLPLVLTVIGIIAAVSTMLEIKIEKPTTAPAVIVNNYFLQGVTHEKAKQDPRQ